jgi:inorganic pyrophosphatase
MLKNVTAGNNVPEDINVMIEIPMNNEPVKYEYNKDLGVMTVDRFLTAKMQYPCNYGFIPQTMSEDGDPVDVLVIAPVKIQPGVIINCRPIGILEMTDESGRDAKIIAVPNNKLTKLYDNILDIDDLSKLLLDQIDHFFTHYKDLDSNKWVKVNGFQGMLEAKKYIQLSIT